MTAPTPSTPVPSPVDTEQLRRRIEDVVPTDTMVRRRAFLSLLRAAIVHQTGDK